MATAPRAVRKKSFKVEKNLKSPGKSIAGNGEGESGGGVPAALAEQLDGLVETGAAQHQDLLNAIESLRSEMFALARKEPPAPAGIDPETFKAQVAEAERLRVDLKELHDAIEETKREIVSLRKSDRDEDKILTAGEALRAVVQDTEKATDGIIGSVEQIEEICGQLVAQSGGAGQNLADALNEHVMAIFEHCNFQDITGQRITKVVNTMEFIDERIARMMEIWGGADGFAQIEVEATETQPEGEILDGPAMPGQSISQDDIDALFD